MLRNKFYTGTIVYDGQEYPGKHVPLIDKDLFQSCIARLPKRTDAPRKNARKYEYMLSGLVRCYCGRHMSNCSINKKGTRFFYYKCTDPHCKNAINAEKLDKKLIEQIKGQNIPIDDIQIILDEAAKIRNEKIRQNEPTFDKIKTEMALLVQKRDRVKESFLSGMVTQDNHLFFNTELTALNNQIEQLQAREKELVDLKASPEIQTAEQIISRLKHFAQMLDLEDSPENRRNAVLAFVQDVIS